MSRRRKPPRPGALTELPPLKILSQIALLQIIYYVSGISLILFTALVAGRAFTLDLVFNWQTLRGDTTVGWMLGFVWMLNAFIGALALLFLVSRSKLIPDFALTIHFLHLLTTCVYSGSLPTNWLWWALQICSAAFMTTLGVYSCRWRELRPITFGGQAAAPKTSGAAPADSRSNTESGSSQPADGEMGYGRGGRRGRGRDGAGEYEMVDIKSETGEG
ncbi:MAG: hypothetical protein M1818_000563 [Claussenomyces sp. TS43310]|nr:MAG: hypothetical protein M1818_000563 [Claussenomyces sp. TS43310]